MPGWLSSLPQHIQNQITDMAPPGWSMTAGGVPPGGLGGSGWGPGYGGATHAGADPRFGPTGGGRGTGEEMALNNYTNASNWLGSNPDIWNPYGGPLVGGQTEGQAAARDSLSGFLAGDPSQYTTQAGEMAGGLAGFTPDQVTAGSFPGGDLGAYMNPYTQNVVDQSAQDIERQRQIATLAGSGSAGADVFGHSRTGVREAETNRAAIDAQARTSAQLRSQGFNTAAGLMSQDQDRAMRAGMANQQAGLYGGQLQLGAANTLGNIGNDYFNQGINAATAQNQFGTQDWNQQNAANQADYQEWLRSTYGPMQGYQFLNNINPGGQAGSNTGAGIAGGAMTGAGYGSAFGPWGALAGGVIGGGLGWLGSQ